RRLEFEERLGGLPLVEEPHAQPLVRFLVERIERRDQLQREILILHRLRGGGERHELPRGRQIAVVVRQKFAQPAARLVRIGLLGDRGEERARALFAGGHRRERRGLLERRAGGLEIAGGDERAAKRQLTEEVVGRFGRARPQGRHV